MSRLHKNYLSILLIGAVFLLGIFLRLYHFPNNPPGLYPDETAIGYNAYSILQTGKDEYGVHMPMYFRSFDDYKMPGYIYTVTLAMKFFGVNAFSVRFPSVFFGIVTIIALYFLLYVLSNKKLFSGIAAFFIAVNPWHTFFSRTGYEVNMATALMVLGTLFFVLAIHKKNNILLFLISILSFLLAAYTYNVTRLVAPLIFFSLIVLYNKQLLNHSKNLLVSVCGLFIIGMLPLVVTQLTLQHQAGFSSLGDALLTGKVAKAEILQTRSYFIGLPGIIQKVLFNYWILLFWKFLSNLVAFFSTAFFFLVGADHPHENIGEFGMFYYADFPLIVYGAYLGLKQKAFYLYPFYLWFAIMLLVGGLIVAIPKDNAFGTRVFPVVIPLIVFSAFGMYQLFEYIINLKNKSLKIGAVIGLAILFGYSYVFYFTSYFVRFPVEYAKEWRSEDIQMVQFVRSVDPNYSKIVFDDSTGITYTSLLFYGKYSPQLHQQQAVYRLNGLVNTLVSDGKYEFRKVDFSKEMATPGTLFITDATHVPENVKPLAVFTYPTRPVVLFYNRQIGQYPTTDIAYELFASGQK